AGDGMIGQRGDEDAGDDGPGLAVTCGEHKCKQLRLVAELAQGDHGCGDEKRFEHRGAALLCHCHNSRAAATIRREKAIIVAFSRNLTGSPAPQRLLYVLRAWFD